MVSKPVYSFPLAAVLIALIFAGCFSSSRPTCPDCNVLLIVIDALRADHLGAYGYERNASPSMDALASQGVMFENSIVCMPFTEPSISAMMTGLYPITHGEDTWFGTKLNESLETLAEMLKEEGYSTIGIVGNRGLTESRGFAQGFDEYIMYDNWSMREGENITNDAIAWLQKNHDKKFFMWLHYMEPHSPYFPPPEHDVFPYGWGPNMSRRDIIPALLTKAYNGTDVSRFISLYDAEIRYNDELVRNLMDALDELELTENTLVILTADHGEELYEHGVFLHGIWNYEESIRVPLIFRLTGKFPEGIIINDQVQETDIMPTILGILGIDPPEGIAGTDLVSVIEGGSYASPYAFGSNTGLKQIFVRTNENKLTYIFYTKEFEFYELANDPLEQENRYQESNETIEELKTVLFDWLGDNKEASYEKSLDQETIDTLKSLGYLS